MEGERYGQRRNYRKEKARGKALAASLLPFEWPKSSHVTGVARAGRADIKTDLSVT